jgi:hypothetical protein
MVAAGISALAQSSLHGVRIGQVQTAGGVAEFDTWVQPVGKNYAESIVTGFAGIEKGAGKTVVRRFVRDNFRFIYLSYAVTVETLEEPGTYRVSFGESDASPVGVRASEDWKFAAPKYPAPQVVRDGDRITLELYSDKKTGQRVVEDLHFGRPDRAVLRTEPAHDPYVDDAEFVLTQPKVRSNGVAVEGGAMPETLRGVVAWLYVPGHGRYVLSFKPHARFARAGEVSGNSLSFVRGGNVFRIDCAERIAAVGSGSYNIYVLEDSGWQPADPGDRGRFMMGTVLGVE